MGAAPPTAAPDQAKKASFDWQDFYPSEREASTVNGKDPETPGEDKEKLELNVEDDTVMGRAYDNQMMKRLLVATSNMGKLGELHMRHDTQVNVHAR